MGIICSHNINVTVNGKTPTYTVPTGLKGTVGNKLSSITLPSGFQWMSPNTVMNSIGNKTYKVKYVPYKANPDDSAAILFTSGSEGTPKAVVLSHKNIVSNVCKYLADELFIPFDSSANSIKFIFLS